MRFQYLSLVSWIAYTAWISCCQASSIFLPQPKIVFQKNLAVRRDAVSKGFHAAQEHSDMSTLPAGALTAQTTGSQHEETSMFGAECNKELAMFPGLHKDSRSEKIPNIKRKVVDGGKSQAAMIHSDILKQRSMSRLSTSSCVSPSSALRDVESISEEELKGVWSVLKKAEEVAVTLIYSDGSSQLRLPQVCIIITTTTIATTTTIITIGNSTTTTTT